MPRRLVRPPFSTRLALHAFKTLFNYIPLIAFLFTFFPFCQLVSVQGAPVHPPAVDRRQADGNNQTDTPPSQGPVDVKLDKLDINSSSSENSLRRQLEQLINPVLENREYVNARFVALPRVVTSIGSKNPAESNKALSEAVDVVYNEDEEVSDDSYTSTISEFFVQAGTRNTDSDEEEQMFTDYYDALEQLGIVESKLITAYNKANNAESDTIGSEESESNKTEQTTIEEMKSWANQVLMDGGDGAAGNFTVDDYKNLTSLETEIQLTRSKVESLSESVEMALDGYMIRDKTTTYPGVFNLSMVIGGDIDSPQAVFAPAYFALVVNSTLLSANLTAELSSNLANAFGNETIKDKDSSTTDDGASSSTASTSASATDASSTSSSTSTTDASTTTSASESSSSSSSEPTNTESTAAPTETPSSRRALRRDIGLARRDILRDAFANAVNKGPPDPEDDGRVVKAPSKFKVALAKAPNAADDSSEPKPADSDDDGIDDIQDVPFVGALFLLKIRWGKWGENFDEYISYTASEKPDLVKEYFGGKTGYGPLRSFVSHVVLAVYGEPDSLNLSNVQLLGVLLEDVVVVQNIPWL